MGGIKIAVHPLFFAVGVVYALTGGIFGFTVCALTAVVHELGHSVAAEKLGYKLNRITLTPFGATVKGNIRGLKFSDELKIALAGPLTNLAIGVLFVALWWVFPEVYAWTDISAKANFSLALINLFPAYPLDGGRILFAIIAQKRGERAGKLVCKTMGILLGATLLAGFAVSAFYSLNLSLLTFGLFALVGSVSAKGESVYARITVFPTAAELKRGMPVKRHAIDKNATLKTLMSLLDAKALNEVDVYDGENRIATLSDKRLREIFSAGGVYDRVEKFT